MADPRRLLDDPAALSELECRVLTAGGAAAPGEQAKHEIWAALAARLPPPGGGGPAGGEGPAGGFGGPAAGAAGVAGASATAVKGAAWVSVVKAASIGASLGVAAMAGTGALTLAAPDASNPPAPAALNSSSSAIAERPAGLVVSPPTDGQMSGRRASPGLPDGRPAPGAPPVERGAAASAGAIEPFVRRGEVAASSQPAFELEPDPPRVGAPPPATAALAAFPRSATPLAGVTAVPPPAGTVAPAAGPITSAPASSAPVHEESRLIAEARDALRSGSPARALSLLEQARRRFPAGTLAQEREALTIEALAASGQRGAASERARRFLSAHPTSFHAARVQRFAGDQ